MRSNAAHPMVMLLRPSLPVRRLITSALLALALAASAGAAPPAEVFFRLPAISEAVLSPSGKHIALVIAGPDRSTALAVADIDKPAQFKGVARLDRGSIARIVWVNDQRIAFQTVDYTLGLAEQSYSGLLAVDRDGKNFRRLISGRARSEQGNFARDPLSAHYRLHTLLRDGSADVIAEQHKYEVNREIGSGDGWHSETELIRLNTETGDWKRLVKNPPSHVSAWLVDDQAVPRLAVAYQADRRRLYWREGAAEDWRQIADQDALDLQGDPLELEGIGPDGTLYVASAQGRADAMSVLTKLDPGTGKPASEPLLALDGFDFRGALVSDVDARRIIGIRYRSDAVGTAWLDPALREMQQQVDKLLPNTNNLIDCGARCLAQRRVLVSAASDLQPALLFVFDRDSGKLDFIGASRPAIDPRAMATRDFVRIAARDGLQIPVHVTKPQGKGPFPAVVLVHGGPYVDGDSWRWAPESQFLASRGYLVIEPDFRGTTRYGRRHYLAGRKEWGLKMQDDITDATRWAVAQGLADAKRLVIAGASYGGYAAMMGLVREPGLYRAGINIVGVTDIGLMFSHGYADLNDFGRRFYLPRLVGDPVKDAAQFEATSPLKQAARIRQPVLMIYGSGDVRVPVAHGTELRDVLRKQGTPVEWVEYADEAHGFGKLENQIDLWTRVERFLVEHTQ